MISEGVLASAIQIGLVGINESLTVGNEPWVLAKEHVNNVLTIGIGDHANSGEEVTDHEVSAHRLVTEQETGCLVLKERLEGVNETTNLHESGLRFLSFFCRVLDASGSGEHIDIVVPVLADSIVVISHGRIGRVQA